MPNCWLFRINKEDHTLGNALTTCAGAWAGRVLVFFACVVFLLGPCSLLGACSLLVWGRKLTGLGWTGSCTTTRACSLPATALRTRSRTGSSSASRQRQPVRVPVAVVAGSPSRAPWG